VGIKRFAAVALLLIPGLLIVAFFGFGRPVGRETGRRAVEPFERLAEDARHVQHQAIDICQ
jgi:hypothetical protein